MRDERRQTHETVRKVVGGELTLQPKRIALMKRCCGWTKLSKRDTALAEELEDIGMMTYWVQNGRDVWTTSCLGAEVMDEAKK